MRRLRFTLLLLILTVGLFSYTGTVIQANQVDEDHRFSLLDDDNSTSTHEDGEDDEEIEDADDDGIDDEKEKAYERELEVEHETHKFKAASHLKNGSQKDEFKVEFDADSDNAAEIRFEYSSEISDATTSNETELSYKVEFDEIIEFVDTGTPGYDNETPVFTYEIGQDNGLGEKGWLPLNVTYDDQTGYVKINATTVDGVFTLLMKLTSSFLVDDNVTLSPNSLKIDVIINDFPYTDPGNTKLSIKTQIQTESSLEVEEESEDEFEGIAEKEKQVAIESGAASGFFSWAETVVMDGQTVDVLSSNVSDPSEDDEDGEITNKVFFTFNSTTAAESIVWDPKLGVVSQGAQANLPAQNTSPSADDSALPQESDTDSGALPIALVWIVIAMTAIPVIRLAGRKHN